jgi:hypothetical protein
MAAQGQTAAIRPRASSLSFDRKTPYLAAVRLLPENATLPISDRQISEMLDWQREAANKWPRTGFQAGSGRRSERVWKRTKPDVHRCPVDAQSETGFPKADPAEQKSDRTQQLHSTIV